MGRERGRRLSNSERPPWLVPRCVCHQYEHPTLLGKCPNLAEAPGLPSPLTQPALATWAPSLLLVLAPQQMFTRQTNLFCFYEALTHSILFSHSVMSDSLRPHGLQHTRLPCPSLSPRVCTDSCPLSRWCHPNILSSGWKSRWTDSGVWVPGHNSPAFAWRGCSQRRSCSWQGYGPYSQKDLTLRKVLACSMEPDTTLQLHGLWSTRLLCPWDSPGKNTGVGCHFLLQGIFSTQGSNPCLLHLLI